ncbi:CD225/dispanin family protein [Amycolatopsis sp. NPDC047767]|uniref:CD225/dispanin family protein n=1 Tax=Amycolatopsis sp. NPDC047767 TaxID=3156765 RepID=UPI003452E70E
MTNPYGQPQPPYGQQPYGTPSGPMPTPYGQYGQQGQFGQQAPFGQPGYGPGMGMPPGGDINAIKEYKGWAIGCIFLMWILAIFAIMKSNEVRTFKMQGNYAMAQQASQTTKTLCLIATIIGGIGYALAITFLIIGIVAATTVTTYCTGYYGC